MIIDELFESPQQCPECGGISFSDLILAEKKDACYHKVKASAKVWPSAYASGRLVQCRKKGAANYGNKSEGVAEGSETAADIDKKIEFHKQGQAAAQYKGSMNKMHAAKIRELEAKKQALKQGVAEGSGQKPTITYKDYTLQYDYQTEDDDPEGYSTATTYYFDVFKDGNRVGEAEYFDYFGDLTIRINGKTKKFEHQHPLASQVSQLVSSLPDEQKRDLSDPKFESQGVAEGAKEDMSKEAKAMASGKCPHCHGPVEKKEHPTLTQYHCAKCGIRASIDKQGVAEGWSQKYKSSINCANPKGFSQRAHCAGRKKNEDVDEGVMYGAENLDVGDDVIISGDVELNGATGVIDSFGQDKRFVVVDLYNHGRHSFHSSDVSANDYDSDEHDDDVLDEKSVSQAQFRTMAAAAHNPKFAKKVGISQDVAQEFNQADKHSNYKKLPTRATEGEQQKGADYRDPKEVDYDDEYDAMVARVKKLAGLGPMKTVYDPTKRQYRNMPTAVQPKK